MDQEKKKMLTIPVQTDGAVDRISALSDHLLSHILSLVSTKESAATSILSTRWKNLFAFVPDIDLEYTHHGVELNGDDAPDKPFLDFIKLCNRMIHLRRGTPIRKLKLSLWRINKRAYMILDSSISAAVSCPIQEVELFINQLKGSILSFPTGIFTCGTLVTLKLNWRRAVCSYLTLPNSVSLPNVKVLHLDFILSVDSGSIHRLIQGCPQLEELYIVLTCPENHHDIGRKRKIEVLDFSSSSIKKLILECWESEQHVTITVGSNHLESLDYRLGSFGYESPGKVIINAPNLKHLATQAPVARLNFVADNMMSSLVRAKITAELEHIFELSGHDVMEHLHRVQNVESICIGMPILEVAHDLLHLMPTFKNLMRLELEFNKRNVIDRTLSWKALPLLLENAPNLEVLVLNHVILDANGAVVAAIFPVCLIENLKEIEMKCLKNEEYEFKIVEHLLQNGKSLRRVAIGIAHELLQPSVCTRILSFKKASEQCQIVFDQIALNANFLN